MDQECCHKVCVCVHYDVLDVLKLRGPADEDTTD